MTDASDPTSNPAPTRRSPAVLWLLFALLVAFAAWRGWAWWQARQQAAGAAQFDTQQQLGALEARLESLRREQRSQAQRLQQADA
ncbi:MAG TPA: hypothetical protein VNS59_03515, partial [Lysobacter sp.]|nr:hypothetical protein [Lysobacter sp.]